MADNRTYGPDPLPEKEIAAAAAVLAGALGDLHRVLRRSASRRAGRVPLPDAQVELLRLVERRPGVSVKEAAERLGTAANTVSTLIGELAGAGLLERERDPENRRVVRLRLTAAARDRIADYAAHRRDLLVAALDRLDAEARREVVRAAPGLRALADLVAEEE
ncbi:MarR family transcriptional regulator [Micromonospora sp. NPDC049559]|uniref:MarR family winged helix-turn-helix transcriptional regulator n=1 Tax=Micromonospora sp. NPDC049559 TaxID=3155923 RepID=UPI0034318E4C